MFKEKSKVIAFAVLFFAAFGIVGMAAAAGYTTHEQIPGSSTTDNFLTYLNQLYRFGIGIAAVLAIIMIGSGAFIYIVTSAGNASKMSNGKDMITSALYGLLIAMIAYIILFLINPDLTNSSIDSVPSVGDYILSPGGGGW